MRTNLIVVFLFIAVAATAQHTASSSYIHGIENHRKKKDTEFKKEATSPIPIHQRRKFKGLLYYPIDTIYRVTATFVRASTQSPFKMKTTTTRLPEYVKYGELHFTLHGQALVLTVYQNLELIQKPEYKDYLFVPFTDATNGEETYGGGRFLDYRIPTKEQVEIDFNLAYNPYCAYSASYSCPIPPKENALPVAIKAGEKSKE